MEAIGKIFEERGILVRIGGIASRGRGRATSEDETGNRDGEARRDGEGVERASTWPSGRGCTERVRKLRQEVLTTPWEVCIERARCYTDVYQSSPEQPIEVQQGPGLSEDPGGDPDPDLPGRAAGRTPHRQAGGLTPLPRGEADLDRERARSLLLPRASAVSRLRSRTRRRSAPRSSRSGASRGARDRFSALLPPEAERALAAGVFVLENEFCQRGGTLLPRLPDAGGAGARGNPEQDRGAAGRGSISPLRKGAEKRQFLRAASIACDGMIRFAARYAELAGEMARGREQTPREGRSFSKIAEICGRVPAEPPRSFREALQAIWLVHLGVMLDDGGVAHALGRLDQILLPLLRRDMERGRSDPRGGPRADRVPLSQGERDRGPDGGDRDHRDRGEHYVHRGHHRRRRSAGSGCDQRALLPVSRCRGGDEDHPAQLRGQAPCGDARRIPTARRGGDGGRIGEPSGGERRGHRRCLHEKGREPGGRQGLRHHRLCGAHPFRAHLRVHRRLLLQHRPLSGDGARWRKELDARKPRERRRAIRGASRRSRR